MTLDEKWENIDHRLRMLETAYQEARELNDEMEGLVKDALTN